MNLQPLVDMSVEFNAISGSDKEIDESSLRNQIVFVRDEVLELRMAAFDWRVTGREEGEIVKEALDVLVTVVGVLQKMQQRGYDIESAAVEVGLNNLSKYPQKHGDMIDTLRDFADKQVNVYGAYNPVYNRYVIRNVETGKVCKPSNYAKVNSSLFKKGLYD